MTTQEKNLILSLPIDIKIELMEGMLKDGQMLNYVEFINILLEAPISEGGVSKEMISEVFNKWKNK